MKKYVTSYLMVTPFFLLFFLFLVFPTMRSFYYSLFNISAIGFHMHFVGFENYKQVFGDHVFWIAMRNMLYMVVCIVPVSLFLSLFISVTVYRRSNFFKSLIRGAFYLPHVISGVTMILVWQFMFNPQVGVINYFLSMVGIPRITWLGDPHMALVAIIIVLITFQIGQPVVIYLASLGAIPDTFYEAALIDGANQRQQFIKITVPLLKPTTLYLLITGTIATFQVFTIVYLLTSGGPNNATQTLVNLLYSDAFLYHKMGPACVIGVVIFFLCTSIAYIQYRFLSEDIEY